MLYIIKTILWKKKFKKIRLPENISCINIKYKPHFQTSRPLNNRCFKIYRISLDFPFIHTIPELVVS